MFKVSSVVVGLTLLLLVLSRSVENEATHVEESEEIGHGLRLDSHEDEIGHGLRLDKREVDSVDIMSNANEEELVGHGIKSNHAWRK